MSAEPWKKWRPEELRELAKNYGPSLKSDALEAFAALLEAEQRGERCVLPREVSWEWLMTCKPHNWGAEIGGRSEIGQGDTQEAAILDLARKLRGK